MGNCLSSNDASALRDLVNRPGESTETKLTADSIKSGLKAVADSIRAKGNNISIVAVGGAVNTVLLRTRQSTSDVDFFYRTKTKHEDVTQVILAADAARKALKLDDHWLNNHTALFIQVGVFLTTFAWEKGFTDEIINTQEGTIQRLYDEAVQQKDIVFNAPGLTVYAAPWRYALAAKLDRLSMPGARPYDLSDAVDYLARLIEKQGGKAVKKSALKAWATEFQFTVPTEDLMNRLAAEYKKKFKKDGVVNG
ncbi:hypothetical protein PQX77_017928 [Marasmius sp. AFHP31]|nr:hypothetical protein PQX77_017928 [Marasmius sp. AFHP31]